MDPLLNRASSVDFRLPEDYPWSFYQLVRLLYVHEADCGDALRHFKQRAVLAISGSCPPVTMDPNVL